MVKFLEIGIGAEQKEKRRQGERKKGVGISIPGKSR
jgi:hypothetical protein